MKKIEKFISALKNMDSDWAQRICEEEDWDELNNEDMKKVLDQLVKEIRKYKKKEDTGKIEEIRKLVENKAATDRIMQYVDRTLVYYNTFSELRKTEEKDENLAGGFLQDAMKNYILRFDPQISSRHFKYGFSDETGMKRVLQSMEYLTDYYVRKRFLPQTILEDFMEETGLSEANCGVYAKLIEKHFQEIKLNLLMRNMEGIQRYLVENMSGR
jgi:hypothetical protein